MASYKLTIQKSAQKEIRKLSNEIRSTVVDLISRLAEDLRPKGCEKLKGSKFSYRIRLRDYRIVYSIKDNELKIQVVKVGHRKDIYRKLK